MKERETVKKETNKLAVQLKEARLQVGLSQVDLAEKLGYETSQFISDWERGIHAPPIKNLSKICKLLNVNEQKIFDLFIEIAKEKLVHDLEKEFKRSKKRS